MMIHDFDMARFLLGEEPVAVSAMGSSLVDKAIGEAGDVDTAVVIMETKSGKVAQISNSRRATYGYDQRIEAHGAKGMLRADNIRETTVEFAGAQGFAGDKIAQLLPGALRRRLSRRARRLRQGGHRRRGAAPEWRGRPARQSARRRRQSVLAHQTARADRLIGTFGAPGPIGPGLPRAHCPSIYACRR